MATKRIVRRTVRSSKAQSKFTVCEDGIASLLTAHDRRPDKVRMGDKWLHVSALVNGDCLRALHIAHSEQLKASVRPRKADRLLWTIGKSVEAHIRNNLIQLYGAENALGQWSCVCGNASYQGPGEPERNCEVCHFPVTYRYSEYHVTHKPTLLSGSPDLILRDQQGKWTPIELKTIKVVPKNGVRTTAPDFHNLESPQRNHSLQVLMYRKLLELSGVEVTDEAMIIYAAKDYIMESPYKPFTVSGSSQENELAVNYLMSLAEGYAQSYESDELPERLSLCTSCTTSRAKACPVVASCFNRRK